MISPDCGLSSPVVNLQSHIDRGAKLLQLKFGHDLPLSIVDGRLNEALSRMLATGAMSWQCLMLPIGLFGYDDINGRVTINGQLTYGEQPMSWSQIDQALGFWTDRGGALEFPLSSGKLIPERFSNIQNRLNRYAAGEDTRVLWPKAPIFFDEIEPTNPHLRKWKVAQKLIRVYDLRPLLCSIPDVRIGETKATAIWDYMAANEIRQDLGGFLSLVNSGKLIKVPGIGKKLLEDIRWGLFKTLDERGERGKKERSTKKKVHQKKIV